MSIDYLNPSKITDALNKIDNISSSSIRSVANSIDFGNWDSPVRNRIIKAIEKIAKEYDEIKSTTSRYRNLPNKVKDYQDIDTRNYEYQVSRLYDQLYSTDDEDEKSSIRDDIYWYEYQIRIMKEKKQRLKNEINSILEG